MSTFGTFELILITGRSEAITVKRPFVWDVIFLPRHRLVEPCTVDPGLTVVAYSDLLVFYI